MYLLLYALGFTLPFILLAFFTSSLLSFFQKYKRVVKYTVRIGALVMILLGIMMIASNIPREREEVVGREFLSEEESIMETETQAENEIEEESARNVPAAPTMAIKVVQELEETETATEKEDYSDKEEIQVEDSEENIGQESKTEEVSEESATEMGSESTEINEERKEEKCDLDYLDYSFLDQNGKIHRLSSYKGKVIFLNAWATWCGPCRSELPEIDELYKKYEDSKDVVVLTVVFPGKSGEGDISSIKSFMKSNGYSYPVLLDINGKLLSALGITAFPTTFLFDKKGNIYGYVPGAMKKERMEGIIETTLNSQ